MNFKNLLKFSAIVFVFTMVLSSMTFAQTVYLDATNGSNAYSGANETNNPAGTGPKATLGLAAGALAQLANGGTLVIKAGNYPEAFDLTTSLPAPVNSFTIVLKQLNVNTDINFTGGAFNINKAGLTVVINQFSGTERVVQAVSGFNFVNGSVNLSVSAAWTAAANAVFNFTGASGLTGAAPAITGVGAGTGIVLNYTGGSSFTAGAESGYASYGGFGSINLTKTAGTYVTFPNAISFNAANVGNVISLTTGGANFSSTVNLGLGDISNVGADNLTITGLVSASVSTAATTAANDISQVINTGTGLVALNGGITWTGGTQAGAKDYAAATYAVSNTNTGTITLGPVALVTGDANATSSFAFRFQNTNAGGTLNVGVVTSAASATNGNTGSLSLENVGTATAAGGLYRGLWTNSGTVSVTGNTTVAGVLTNSLTVALGVNTLTLSGSVAHLTNGGTITATTGGVNVSAAGASSFNGGALSNLTISGAGACTLQTNAVTMTNVNVNNGTLVIAVGTTGAPTQASGTTTVAGGTFTINTTIVYRTQNFVENVGGTVNLTAGATTTLDVKGNFSRTAGAFNLGGAANTLLSLTGTGNQVIDGGPLFQVENMTFTNSVGSITVNNTIRVSALATISTATTVNFGTVNLVLNAAAAKIINNGNYNTTAGSGGGVIVGGGTLVPLGVFGGGQTLEGTGIFGTITVDVGAANFASVVNTLTGVKFNNILRLYTGDLRVATAGIDFSPYGTGAKVIRHLWNDVAANQPHLTVTGAGATWNAAAVNYDLEYAFGNDLVNRNVDVLLASLEFPVALRVNNLTISATASGTGSADLTANRTILGNLSVVAGATFRLNAASLTANSLTGAHSIAGNVTQATPAAGEVLNLTGGGTVTASGTGIIWNLNVNTTGAYTITGFAQLGQANAASVFQVNGGAVVTLSMANTGVAPAIVPGTIFNTAINNGRVNLGYHMAVPNNVTTSFTVGATGTFDFGDWNLYWYAPATTVFTSNAAATFLATGAVNNGYLQIRNSADINTAGALVPRIIIDPAAAGVYTLMLLGNTGVKDIFTNTGNDILDLFTFTFNHGGNTWNHGGTATVISSGAGTGVFLVTGNVTANLGAAVSLPNFTVNNTTNTLTLVNNTGGAAPAITVTNAIAVPGKFTFTTGTINQGASDIILTDAGAVFAYAAGTFNQTVVTGTAGTDAGNGELVFNAGAVNQTFATGTTVLTIPNLRIAGTGGQTVGLTSATGFTVSKRLVFGGGATFNFGAAGIGTLTLSDQCWVERRGAAVLQNIPTFAGVIDLWYSLGGAYATAKELPTGATVLRDLFISTNINAAAAAQVNRTLTLTAGNYDMYPGANSYPITMAANTTVNVINGFLISTTAGTTLIGGPITLNYANTVARATTSLEFPATAGFVTTLNVNTNMAANAAWAGAAPLTLHANRTVGTFVLSTAAANPANIRFDLAGNTLTATTATLTRGQLVDYTNAGVPAVFSIAANLTVTGVLTSAAAASVYNVNFSAATLNFAGPFGTLDFEGTVAAPNLSGAFPTAVVTGTASIAAFLGNLTVGDVLTVNGAYTGGTITASTDVTVATGGSMNAATNLVFVGTANATLTVPAAGATIGAVTFNKTNNSNTITLAGGNLAATGLTTFVNGLFVTGANRFNLWVPLFGGGQGFTRVGVIGTNISHVVGNVAKTLFNAGGPGLGGSSEPRQEFPVGSMTAYKLVAITFQPAFGLPTTPNATLMVSYADANPNGAVGLPITNGVANGIDVSKYPSFYWTIASAPFSIGPTTPFDLELTGTGFTNFDDVNNVRIIRRHGGVGDVTNQWLLQGTNSSYDNSVNAGIPTIIQRGANAGLRVGGAVFTYGLKSNMKIKNAIPKQWLVLSQGAQNYNVTNLFQGNIGTLSYVAQTSNASIATVTITGSTLQIAPVAVGDAVVTVTAQDLTYNDFFAYSFPVNVGLTDVQTTEQLPTEFALFQNYPNPFNPTTNIKFDLPKESNVTLKVYNILGEEVTTLVNKVMPAGHQVVTFDAARLASGMYIYRIEAGNFVQVKKMLLMK